MKKVDFKKLFIQNFLSVGNEPIEISFSQGINIITGVNLDMISRTNAVGKSTIADAFYFAIFGTTLRDLKKDLIHNYITNNTCVVRLEYDVTDNNRTKTYKIVRTLAPGKCFLYEDDVDVTRDSMSNTTTLICESIEATPAIFKNCVITTLNDTIPFMAQSKIDKRKFIESIFNLEVFSKMLSHVREDYNTAKRLYDLELKSLSDCTRDVKRVEEQIANIKQERSVHIQRYNQKRLDNVCRIDELRHLTKYTNPTTVEMLEKKLVKLQHAKTLNTQKLSGFSAEAAVVKASIKDNQQRLNGIHIDGAVCSRCLTPLDNELHRRHVEEQKAQLESLIAGGYDDLKALNDNIKRTADDIETINNTISSLKLKMDDCKKIESQAANAIDSINLIQKHIEDIDIELSRLSVDTTDVDPIYSELKIKESQISENIIKQLKQVNMLDSARFVMSEEGAKSLIIKKILHTLNNKLQYYINEMGLKYSCKFDQYFEEEITNAQGRMCSYFNFSGAERKSIDLACLFAFIDMRKLQGNVSYNVVFYDELLDTSLDDKGVETIFNILKKRSSEFGECTYIITHRKSSSYFVDSKVIMLEKRNYITRMVD